MEKLTEQKRANIKKMVSDRIIKYLIEAGLDVEEVDVMSRENLMRALAEVWLKKEAEEKGAVGDVEEKPIGKTTDTDVYGGVDAIYDDEGGAT